MILISHRGNINGIDSAQENAIPYINNALELGYHVEIDVRGMNGKLFLGHDEIQEEISGDFLSNQKFWIHAKNTEAVELLVNWNNTSKNHIHWFWHQQDDITLTSLNYVWTYPGKEISSGAIAVLPENFPGWDLEKAGGICSDNILFYKNKYMI
jgi:hypothetical protein